MFRSPRQRTELDGRLLGGSHFLESLVLRVVRLAWLAVVVEHHHHHLSSTLTMLSRTCFDAPNRAARSGVRGGR